MNHNNSPSLVLVDKLPTNNFQSLSSNKNHNTKALPIRNINQKALKQDLGTSIKQISENNLEVIPIKNNESIKYYESIDEDQEEAPSITIATNKMPRLYNPHLLDRITQKVMMTRERYENLQRGYNIKDDANNGKEETQKLPVLVNGADEIIHSTYCVKYFGINNNQIGILSRRVPLKSTITQTDNLNSQYQQQQQQQQQQHQQQQHQQQHQQNQYNHHAKPKSMSFSPAHKLETITHNKKSQEWSMQSIDTDQELIRKNPKYLPASSSILSSGATLVDKDTITDKMDYLHVDSDYKYNHSLKRNSWQPNTKTNNDYDSLKSSNLNNVISNDEELKAKAKLDLANQALIEQTNDGNKAIQVTRSSYESHLDHYYKFNTKDENIDAPEDPLYLNHKNLMQFSVGPGYRDNNGSIINLLDNSNTFDLYPEPQRYDQYLVNQYILPKYLKVIKKESDNRNKPLKDVPFINYGEKMMENNTKNHLRRLDLMKKIKRQMIRNIHLKNDPIKITFVSDKFKPHEVKKSQDELSPRSYAKLLNTIYNKNDSDKKSIKIKETIPLIKSDLKTEDQSNQNGIKKDELGPLKVRALNKLKDVKLSSVGSDNEMLVYYQRIKEKTLNKSQ